MICLLAVVVFGILGIFSATHRRLALEALQCVFRRIRLKPCVSGLDIRLKSQVTGWLMRGSPVVARFTFRYFELLSWAFTILMLASLVLTALGIYNYLVYDNCGGPGATGPCLWAVASPSLLLPEFR